MAGSGRGDGRGNSYLNMYIVNGMYPINMQTDKDITDLINICGPCCESRHTQALQNLALIKMAPIGAAV